MRSAAVGEHRTGEDFSVSGPCRATWCWLPVAEIGRRTGRGEMRTTGSEKAPRGERLGGHSPRDRRRPYWPEGRRPGKRQRAAPAARRRQGWKPEGGEIRVSGARCAAREPGPGAQRRVTSRFTPYEAPKRKGHTTSACPSANIRTNAVNPRSSQVGSQT
jgi:hypothetical protein